MTAEKQFAIARDYYTGPFSVTHIAEKHGTSPQLVNYTAKKFKREDFRETDQCVIKIDKKSIAYASELLTRHGIRHEVPEKFELTEFIESSINR